MIAPPLLTTSSENRACSSSAGGMGALNSSSCSGTLSFRLISGGSLLPKQHRKPRPGRVLFLGGIVAAVTQVVVVGLDQEDGRGRGLGQGGGVERRMRLLSGGHDLEEREQKGRNSVIYLVSSLNLFRMNRKVNRK